MSQWLYTLGTMGSMNWTSMILTFLVLILMFIDLSGPREDWLNPWNIFYVDSACCVFFLTEFVFGYRCADDKRWFMRHHWIDLVTSIPIPPTQKALGLSALDVHFALHVYYGSFDY